MRRNRKYVVRLSDNNLQNTLYNAINAGIDSYDPNYFQGSNNSANGKGKPGQITLPKFTNPFDNVKLPEVVVRLNPDTQKMIDNGIKILAISIAAHGVLSYFSKHK